MGIPFKEMKTDTLKNDEFKTEYDKLKPRDEATRQIIKTRKSKESYSQNWLKE